LFIFGQRLAAAARFGKRLAARFCIDWQAVGGGGVDDNLSVGSEGGESLLVRSHTDVSQPFALCNHQNVATLPTFPVLVQFNKGYKYREKYPPFIVNESRMVGLDTNCGFRYNRFKTWDAVFQY
jgi:hypothetical protein